MYIPPRAAQVRNLSVAAVNGLITLVILLIAPLGLLAVIVNTLLVMVATYATATAGDRIIQSLLDSQPQRVRLTSDPGTSSIRRAESSSLDRFEDE
ncbi:MAG TPA: hypothetical protein IGS37_15535 [Synechococcales cyanobacterium M55_K2018_004]|nr:hypothetical protein [Synechococcales cyanobacterium M55_K2018_004]